jgi:small redox-active disulfide protein 2
MKIEILGTGCAKCHLLEQTAKAAADSLGLAYELTHVTDIREFAKRGVIFTPALTVDGRVVVAGRVPSESEVRGILQKAAAEETG